MNTISPTSPPFSNCGAKPLNAAIPRRRDAEQITPSDPIREQAGGDHRAQPDDPADDLDHQEPRGAFGGEQRHPRQWKHGHHVEQCEARQRGECADDDVAPVALQRRADGRGLEVLAFEQRGVIGGRDHSQPCEQRDDVDREGDEERVAPPPVEEIGGGQRREEEGEQPARHDQPERRAQTAGSSRTSRGGFRAR